jgi:pyroglutamyl-peptidase
MVYVHRGLKQALLTGYEPWGEMTSNPTMDVVGSYRGRKVGKTEIVTDVLPTSFRGSEEKIQELIDKYGPDIVLELGLGERRRKLKLEKRARNVHYAKVADNDGFRPRGGKILQRGPDMYYATMDMGYLNGRLNAEGIPARVSSDAGRYVCNSTYYMTLDRIHRSGMDAKAGFVHMPWTTRYVGEVDMGAGWPMEEKDVVRAVTLILREA